MADLVTSESRRYLHGIQNTIISDDDTGVVQSIIPSNSQLALVDQMEVDGTLTVYGDAYVTSSKNADSLSGVNHNAIAGRDVYAAHPASSVSLVPVGSVVATDMQSAVAELDAGKVASNPSLTPSTKTKITYDSKGLVTSGNDATASDIAYAPYGGVVAVNVQDAINAVESHAASAQTAASNAASAASSASAAAAYADRLARSSNNLIKNGNSEDPNPTGYEAAGLSTGNPYVGSKSRKTVIPAGGTWHGFDVGRAPCAPGDQFVYEAMVADWNGVHYHSLIGIYFSDAEGSRVGDPSLSPLVTTPIYTRVEVSETAPAGAAWVVFFCESTGGPEAGGDQGWFDCLYACRKVSAGMLEAGILKALLDKGEVIETPNYVTGSAGVAPVGVKIAGAPFPATLRDGSTLQVNMELGTGASVGGESVQAILDASVYADTLARSNNRIKNGNSEDPNPTGWEAAWVSDSGAYIGTKCRALTVAVASYGDSTVVGESPCDPGDQFVFSAWGKQAAASSGQRIYIEFKNAAGDTTGTTFEAFPASTVYTQAVVFGKAPAGTVKVRFRISAFQPQYATTYYWDYLYAELKFPAVVLAEDAVQSTTHTFTVSNATASTSTTTGAIVATGGIATSDYFTGRYRSQDGSAGLTVTKTFYAASSSGGSPTVLNTVVVKNGIITSWTQA